MANVIARVILDQLGGTKFLVMTGAKQLVADGNTLRMTLPMTMNISKANRLWITLEGNDTYTMRFFHYTPGRVNKKTFEWIADKTKEIKTIKDVYCDELQVRFREVTGMDTHL